MTHPQDQTEIDTHPIDPDLERTLHHLFDRYGVLGVITAAARYGLRVATPRPATMRRTPQLGDMVRVDTDPGYGIKGAVAKVEQVDDAGWVVVVVAYRHFTFAPEDVTVVTYDNDTREWAEVR